MFASELHCMEKLSSIQLFSYLQCLNDKQFLIYYPVPRLKSKILYLQCLLIFLKISWSIDGSYVQEEENCSDPIFIQLIFCWMWWCVNILQINRIAFWERYFPLKNTSFLEQILFQTRFSVIQNFLWEIEIASFLCFLDNWGFTVCRLQSTI